MQALEQQIFAVGDRQCIAPCIFLPAGTSYIQIWKVRWFVFLLYCFEDCTLHLTGCASVTIQKDGLRHSGTSLRE
jgi:hypothetical protein